METTYIEDLQKKVDIGDLAALREYGEMLVLGRYFRNDIYIPQDKEHGKKLLTKAALEGDKKALQLLFHYKLHSQETFSRQKKYAISKKPNEYEELLRKVDAGDLAALQEYGEILVLGLYFSKEIYIPQNKERGKKLLTRAALEGDQKALQLLFHYELLNQEQFQEQKLEYVIDKKLSKLEKKKQITLAGFIFSVATGVVTFLLTRSIFGEGISGTGSVGVAIVAAIVVILAATSKTI